MLEVTEVNNAKSRLPMSRKPQKSCERKEASSSGSARAHFGQRWRHSRGNVRERDDAEVDGVETIRMRYVPSLPNPEAR
jgi:hypothetical protein